MELPFLAQLARRDGYLIRHGLIAFVACAALAACSVRPDGSNGQRRGVNLPEVSYEKAYHRANDYLNQCVRGFVGFAPNVTTGNLYPSEQRGELQTANSSGLVVLRLTTAADGSGSRATIVTIKRAGSWNSKDLDAIEAAMKTGAIACK